MNPGPEILAIIPARQGSKSIPHKNIRSLAGKPLLAYSIEHALAAGTVTRVIVSTDSPLYADIARKYGAEVPFLRPADISGDHSTDLEVFVHVLEWLRVHEHYVPDVCVHLRPTHPVRNPADIDAMVGLLLADETLDSVRAVVESPETPFKMWFQQPDGRLRPVVQTDIQEAYNQPRQVLPQTYLQNASIDVVRTKTVSEKHSMTGTAIQGYLMQEMYDIDHEAQLQAAAAQLQAGAGTTGTSPKTYCFDIDGVIATLTPDNDYTKAEGNPTMIDAVNALYDAGHEIILFTARGSKTGIDWAEVTRLQMERWGVRHHALRFGKPAADYYIDDRMLSFNDLAASVRRIASR